MSGSRMRHLCTTTAQILGDFFLLERSPLWKSSQSHVQRFCKLPERTGDSWAIKTIIDRCTRRGIWCVHLSSFYRMYLASHIYRLFMFSLEVCKSYLTCASRIGWRSPIGARDEATSSENQVVAYACSASILKHSPPTIYHGLGLAWGSHPGSYRSAMSKSEDSHTK